MGTMLTTDYLKVKKLLSHQLAKLMASFGGAIAVRQLTFAILSDDLLEIGICNLEKNDIALHDYMHGTMERK